MPSRSAGFVVAGAVAALLAVVLGAFGAHGLRTIVAPELMVTFHTGVEYHFYAAFGLIAIGLCGQRNTGWPVEDTERAGADALLVWAGWLMLSGIALFSGSLYVIAVSGIRAFGMITPLGGLAFIASWAMLARAAWRCRQANDVTIKRQ